MMVCKKASLNDLERLAITIMVLNGSEVEQDDVKTFIDRCYYFEDTVTKSIVALVAAVRTVLEFPSEVEGEIIQTYPNKYTIKYCLFDYNAIVHSGEDPSRLLSYLIKELTADMNDWPVVIDPTEQAMMNKLNSYDQTMQSMKPALEKNSFKIYSDHLAYMRASPINFMKIR